MEDEIIPGVPGGRERDGIPGERLQWGDSDRVHVPPGYSEERGQVRAELRFSQPGVITVNIPGAPQPRLS